MKARLTTDNKFLYIYEYEQMEIEQIRYTFKKRIQNWRWHPLVKRKLWDGYISFIDKYNRIPVGLWNELSSTCKKFGYELYIDDIDKIVDYDLIFDEFKEWVLDFFKDHPDYKVGGSKEIRDYQIEGVYHILKFKMSCSEIATSAGKTLMIFMIFAYLLDKGLANRYMIVVPNTSLIIQTMEDFEDYNNGKLKFTIQPIHAGTDKRKTDAECIIGTFQSLSKRDSEWFNDIDAICIDEAHYTGCVSIKNIISKCNDLQYRFGLSGTMKKEENSADHFTLQAYLGPFVNDISAKFLIDNEYATKVFVKIIRMNYLEVEIREKLQSLRDRRNEFQGTQLLDLEKRIVIENRRRFNYIVNFISKVSKNSLILFADIKNEYGKKVYNWLKQNTDKEVFYVDGGTAIDLRTMYFEKMESGTNKLMVASFGTLSTGVSINNIHNIFLTESFKSDRIIRQSIGRGMRLLKDKERVTIIDFVDDFTQRDKNYLRKHGDERCHTYKQQGFPFQIYEIAY